MTELDDFAQALLADLESRLPGLKQLSMSSRDILLRSGRTIGGVTMRAMTKMSRPEDPALAQEAEAAIANIQVAGTIRLTDEFNQSAANILKQGWEILKKVLPFPLP